MAVSSSTLDETLDRPGSASHGPPTVPALVILWSRDEEHLVGACLLPPLNRSAVFGRGDGDEDALAPVQQRPGSLRPVRAPANPRLSRAQLRIVWDGGEGLAVDNIGRCALIHQGAERARCRVRPGETLRLGNQMLLLCAGRPAWMVADPETPVALHAFGEADAHGLVGESPAIWALRQRVAFVGGRPGHVLIQGPSGSGKELVAQALHASSPRAARPLVARNAATLPEGLLDAELFGNIRNYPNPGMPERPGLLGQAHLGTLFLDEFAELPLAAQTHLLRVLDAGDYQRLGDASPRRADVRLLAATNRPRESLREDLAARLPHVVAVPPLDERREDIPLLVRHQLGQLAAADRSLGRFLGPDGLPRLDLGLVSALVERSYRTNARELHALLWEAIGHSPGAVLTASPELLASAQQASASPPPRPSPSPPWTDPPAASPSWASSARPASSPAWAERPGSSPAWAERPGSSADSADSARPGSSPSWSDGAAAPTGLTPERIQACLNANNGSIERSWSMLGLSSRHALKRLITKYGLEIRKRPGSAADDE